MKTARVLLSALCDLKGGVWFQSPPMEAEESSALAGD